MNIKWFEFSLQTYNEDFEFLCQVFNIERLRKE